MGEEVVVAGFCVTFFAGKMVLGGVGNAAEMRRNMRRGADCAGGGERHTGRPRIVSINPCLRSGAPVLSESEGCGTRFVSDQT